jgi:hypothetical protein
VSLPASERLSSVAAIIIIISLLPSGFLVAASQNQQPAQSSQSAHAGPCRKQDA